MRWSGPYPRVLARSSLSLCMWGSRRSTCAGTRERNAAGCGCPAAVQRWPKGHLGCDKRAAWVARSPRRVTQLSPRRGGSLDSLQKVLALGVHCPVTIRLALNKTLRRCNDAADIISYSQVCPHNYTPRARAQTISYEITTNGNS